MFICYIYRHLCFDDVYMPIKNLNLNLNLVRQCGLYRIECGYMNLRHQLGWHLNQYKYYSHKESFGNISNMTRVQWAKQ